MRKTYAKIILEPLRLTSFYSALQNFIALMERSCPIGQQNYCIAERWLLKAGWDGSTSMLVCFLRCVMNGLSCLCHASQSDRASGGPPRGWKSDYSLQVVQRQVSYTLLEHFGQSQHSSSATKMHCLDTKWRISTNKAVTICVSQS